MYKYLNKNFNLELNYAIKQSRRPHFIFSTRHQENGTNPVCLSEIPNTYFERFHPRGGRVSRQTDKVKIEQLVNDLLPYLKPDDNAIGLKIASKKVRKRMKKKHWGRYVYCTNDGENRILTLSTSIF